MLHSPGQYLVNLEVRNRLVRLEYRNGSHSTQREEIAPCFFEPYLLQFSFHPNREA